MFSDKDKARLKNSFNQQLNDCSFILCPKGDGISSRRFYETLAAGRIPILISDHYELPLGQHIDYSKFVVRAPENDIENIDKYLDKIDRESASVEARRAHQEYFSDIVKFVRYSISSTKTTHIRDQEKLKAKPLKRLKWKKFL